MKKRLLLMTALAVTAIATGAMATSLSMIPPVGADTTSSGRAIVLGGGGGGGAIVVGQSGTGTGIIYDGTSRAVVSSDGAAATVLTGVGYRTVAPGVSQLVAHGLTSSGHNIYSSMDDGVTWGPKNRYTNQYTPFSIGSANTLGALGTDDKFYFGFWWSSETQLELHQGSDGVAPDYKATLTGSNKGTTNKSRVYGVSGSGLAVGYRRSDGGGTERNYILQWNGTGTPTPSFFDGLKQDGANLGQAWSVSNDGAKVFGMSPVADGRSGNWPYIYDVGSGGITELPTFGDTAGSSTNGLPYGASQDGNYAVGMNYRGTEKAVLWGNLLDPNPANWTVTDLTDFFGGLGQLDGFTRLSRGYSVYDAGGGDIWITGQGVWSPDGGVTDYTRGFVALVPEPHTLALFLLGLPILRRRGG